METILGIDLGTTNSVVSIIQDGNVRVLEENGQKTLPSVVGLDPEGKLLVGFPARNQWTLAPDRTVRSIKRKMGSAETVPLGDQSYTPQEISAIILRTLKELACRQSGQDLRKAVITVPAFFNEQQREATREAGQLAGLDVVRIINEPTAASLTYNPKPTELERLLVYDLGGGTFDVSIVQIEQGVVEVLSSHGDTQLGGDDFDQLLMDFVCDRFEQQHKVDLRASLVSKSRVLKAVEEAKRRLSDEAFTRVEEEFITEKAGVPLHLNMELSRLDYEPLIEPLLSKTLVCVDEALSDSHLTAKQIDRVVLVGGASRTPLVHRLLQEQLGQPIHAEVDPDLCVSMGAAIQGGLIAGLDLGPVLVDITPHTLGIDCVKLDADGGMYLHGFAPIIERNTALPASRSKLFGTLFDKQKAVTITVYQGEDSDARFNDPIGQFTLEGLAEAKRGNEILVRFELDLDGILTATAIEKRTGLQTQLTIDNAISRFRADDREAAQDRLDAAFGGTPSTVPVPSPPPAADDKPPVPDALRETVEKAQDLLERAEKVLAEAAAEDSDEMRELMDQLRQAIDSHEADTIHDVSAKLDDLVFYLQDVS
jgi:molecular chaperone DnaK